MQYSACNYSVENHVATITLNRPDKGNALNEQMIAELTDMIHSLSNDVQVLCIRAAGKHFCTGADLHEMQHNLSDPQKLANLLQAFNNLNVPMIAAVNGATFGGALGLLATCDLVIAQDEAVFCLSEVKLGLVPAVISPYMIQALGPRAAKMLMLTAEKFIASTAMQLGLVHQIVPLSKLDEATNDAVKNLLSNGPEALRAVKKLCREVMTFNNDKERQQYTVNLLKQIRQSQEAQERLKDFFEKKHV